MILGAASVFLSILSLLIIGLGSLKSFLYRLMCALIISIIILYRGTEFWIFFVHIVLDKLIIYWCIVLVVLLPIPFLASSNTHSESKTVLWRKFFHFIVLVLFGPLLVSDEERHVHEPLIALAGIMVLWLFMILEVFRLTGRPSRKLAGFLNHVMRPLLDKKDKGSRIVTSHMELLFAIVFPVWLAQVVGGIFADRAYVLSGLLTVGIGDSAAALGGICLSKSPHKLPWNSNRSTKSVEGLLSFVAAINLALWVIGAWDTISAAASLLTAISEAYIPKYDNAALPLVYSFTRMILESISR